MPAVQLAFATRRLTAAEIAILARIVETRVLGLAENFYSGPPDGRFLADSALGAPSPCVGRSKILPTDDYMRPRHMHGDDGAL